MTHALSLSSRRLVFDHQAQACGEVLLEQGGDDSGLSRLSRRYLKLTPRGWPTCVKYPADMT